MMPEQLTNGTPLTTRKHSSSSNLTFRIFPGLAGLRSLADVWQQVLAGLEQPEFFHQFAWYEAILTTWPSVADDTCFVVAYQDQNPIGICPLQIIPVRVLGVTTRMLTPPDPNSVAYPDFIYASNERSPELLPALLNALRSTNQLSWDFLALPKAFNTATIEPTSARLDEVAGMIRHQRDVCFYFPCDQGMDAISANISKGLRTDMRRCRRQLSQFGNLEFVWSRDPALLPGLLDEFLTLEASGWKGSQGEGTAIKLDPTLVRFYNNLAEKYGESGNCEINLMRLNGRNIAGNFSLLSNGIWNQLKIAYDEEFRKQSPGYVLMEGMLARLCDDPGVRTANILTGAEWAVRMHPAELEVWRIIARNRTPKGHLVLQETRLRRFVHDRVKPFAADVRAKLRRRASSK